MRRFHIVRFNLERRDRIHCACGVEHKRLLSEIGIGPRSPLGDFNLSFKCYVRLALGNPVDGDFSAAVGCIENILCAQSLLLRIFAIEDPVDGTFAPLTRDVRNEFMRDICTTQRDVYHMQPCMRADRAALGHGDGCIGSGDLENDAGGFGSILESGLDRTILRYGEQDGVCAYFPLSDVQFVHSHDRGIILGSMHILVIGEGGTLRDVTSALESVGSVTMTIIDISCVKTREDIQLVLGNHFDLAIVDVLPDAPCHFPDLEPQIRAIQERIQRQRPRSALPESCTPLSPVGLALYLREKMYIPVLFYDPGDGRDEIRKRLQGEFSDDDALVLTSLIVRICRQVHRIVPRKYLQPFPERTMQSEPPISLFTGLSGTSQREHGFFEKWKAAWEAGRRR